MRSTSPRGEDGAILALFALLLVALLAVAAIVVDGAALRHDRRMDRLAADAAATAGASRLDPLLGGSPSSACQVAWDYALENLPDEGASVAAPTCSTTFAAACTTATAARTATGTAGPYVVEITNPVLDASPLMRAEVGGGDKSQTVNPAVDGAPCQRIGVRIVRDRKLTLAGVIGMTNSKTDVHSVATMGMGGLQGELVPLVVLDPHGCEALLAKGGGNPADISGVRVTRNGDTPGIIVVDSDATTTGNSAPGCANSYAIDAFGEQNSFILAESSPTTPGLILSYALAGPGAAKAYDAGDVPPDDQVVPQPTLSGRRIGREPVDRRYNCKAANGCTEPPAPYIDNLRTQLDGTGVPSDGTFGSGWKVYKDGSADLPSAKCVTNASDPEIVVPAGNWFVDCGTPKGFELSSRVTFEGGNVVFREGINLKSDAVLTVNSDWATNGTNSIVFVRHGDLVKGAQSSLFMRHTTVVLQDGVMSMGGGGSGVLNWTGPVGATDPFEDLCLWSESSGQHDLGGAAGLVLEGVLFMPNANPFLFSGQGGLSQTKAQFITYRLKATGQGLLQMSPDPDRVVLIPLRRPHLVR